MYSRKLAGSGISRNFLSQSRSVWLDRGAYPTKETSSEARVKGDAARAQISSKAANRRMQSLSKWNAGDYSGIVKYVGTAALGCAVERSSTRSAAPNTLRPDGKRDTDFDRASHRRWGIHPLLRSLLRSLGENRVTPDHLYGLNPSSC